MTPSTHSLSGSGSGFRVALLDLNHTLVTNSTAKTSPFAEQIERETYCERLPESLRGMVVVLVTARPAKYEARTLARIAEAVGLVPDAAYFNFWPALPPPAHKSRVLPAILERFGTDPAQYVAIESNPRSRAMYAKQGIVAMPRSEWLA